MSHFPLSDAEYKALCPQWTAVPTEISVSTSTAKNGSDLSNGLYWVKADIDTYVRQGDSSVTATTSSFLFEAGVIYPLMVDGSDNARVAGITAAGSGTLQVQLIQLGPT